MATISATTSPPTLPTTRKVYILFRSSIQHETNKINAQIFAASEVEAIAATTSYALALQAMRSHERELTSIENGYSFCTVRRQSDGLGSDVILVPQGLDVLTTVVRLRIQGVDVQGEGSSMGNKETGEWNGESRSENVAGPL